MPSKFHLTDEGPKPCSASKKDCKYGSSDHFNSLDEAYSSFEEKMDKDYEKSLQGLRKVHPRVQKFMDTMGVGQEEAERILTAMGHGFSEPESSEKEESGLSQVELKDTCLNILDEDLEFPDHSPELRDFAKISDLKDPKIASNNCFAASSAIQEYLSFKGISSESIEIVMDDGSVHWANKVDGTVIDFSFRQFDSDCDFPVVEEYEEWKEELNRAADMKLSLIHI